MSIEPSRSLDFRKTAAKIKIHVCWTGMKSWSLHQERVRWTRGKMPVSSQCKSGLWILPSASSRPTIPLWPVCQSMHSMLACQLCTDILYTAKSASVRERRWLKFVDIRWSIRQLNSKLTSVSPTSTTFVYYMLAQSIGTPVMQCRFQPKTCGFSSFHFKIQRKLRSCVARNTAKPWFALTGMK